MNDDGPYDYLHPEFLTGISANLQPTEEARAALRELRALVRELKQPRPEEIVGILKRLVADIPEPEVAAISVSGKPGAYAKYFGTRFVYSSNPANLLIRGLLTDYIAVIEVTDDDHPHPITASELCNLLMALDALVELY